MSVVALKIIRGNEIRRISFSQNEEFQQLKKSIKELYDIKYDFSFTYLDHEGDEICLGSDLELSEAFRICQYDHTIDSPALTIRIVGGGYKKRKNGKKEKKNREQKTQTEAMIHFAFCDMCNSRIIGARFNCLECEDFDLCSACMADSQKDHPSHQFACISNPFQLEELRAIKQNRRAEANVIPEIDSDNEIPALEEVTLPYRAGYDVNIRPTATDLEPLETDCSWGVEAIAEEEDFDDDEFVDWDTSDDEEEEEEMVDLFDSLSYAPQSEEVQEVEEPREEIHISIEKIEDKSPILTFRHEVLQPPVAVNETPIVVPSPLAASVSQTQFPEQHRQLVDMGFHDLQKNEACLVATQGDLIQAVLSLLDQ